MGGQAWAEEPPENSIALKLKYHYFLFTFYTSCKQDTTMEYTYNLSASSQQLKIRSFRFFNDYDVVYFRCELLACYKGSSNSRFYCEPSMLHRRRGSFKTAENRIKLYCNSILVFYCNVLGLFSILTVISLVNKQP